jgi:hypothetical protein
MAPLREVQVVVMDVCERFVSLEAPLSSIDRSHSQHVTASDHRRQLALVCSSRGWREGWATC